MPKDLTQKEADAMTELFSEAWFAGFGEEWNAEPGLADALAKIDFDSNVAYGFTGEDTPRGVLEVKGGHVVKAGAYTGQPLNWDIRHSREGWEAWMKKPPTMMNIGVAYTTGKMKFIVGDYAAMIRDPRMAGPFIKSFAAMAKVA